MPSPFPGMDPYLEAHWGDIHQCLITYSRDWLQARLPADLRARVEERVFVESPDGARRSIFPDVRVIERPQKSPSEGGVAVAEPAAEPFVIHVPAEEVTEGYIEIRETGSGHRVVTTIEFVSLTNKQPGIGRDLYLRKQQELRVGSVNSVEIDLLRAGEYALSLPRDVVPPECRTPYRICVWRAARPDAFDAYPVPLEARLPTIRIPLRPQEPDVPLNLQALLDQCYLNGGYSDIDYTTDPDPPLPAATARWADDLLRSRGQRSAT